jgi:hypothetical protein
MRHRLLLFAPLLLLSLLGACSKPGAGPRLDLVGATRYTSYDRTLVTPGDTVPFKLYSDVRDKDKPLSHVRIFVTYAPVKNPLVYPAQGYDPTKAPADPTFTYLDTVLTDTKTPTQFVLQNTLSSRTTSGREQWRFEAEDVDGNKASRGFRLQLRNGDSALTYHRYTAQIQAPNAAGSRRSYLALLPGLTLPRYTVRTNVEAQSLVDLVYVTNRNGTYLASPNDTIAHLPKWPNRAIEIRNPRLDKAGFDNTDTGEELTAAFTGSQSLTPATRTGNLVKGLVYSFYNKVDQKYGLIFIQDVITAPVPTLIVQVRITK